MWEGEALFLGKVVFEILETWMRLLERGQVAEILEGNWP